MRNTRFTQKPAKLRIILNKKPLYLPYKLRLRCSAYDCTLNIQNAIQAKIHDFITYGKNANFVIIDKTYRNVHTE